MSTPPHTERATRIAERLAALGLSDREFEARTRIDRKALRRAANGEPVRSTTYTAIETWLDRIESGGSDAPADALAAVHHRLAKAEAQIDALARALHLTLVAAQPTSKWLDAKMAEIDETYDPEPR